MSPPVLRMTSAVLFLGATSVLLLALWLSPDPSGVGTHTQLGLKPCIVMSMLDLPCPMCGMTTTFSLMADLRPLDAFLNQPFGVLLFMITVTVAAVSGLEIVYPKKRWNVIVGMVESRKRWLVGVFSLGFFGGWLYKIAIIKEMFTSIP